MKKSLFLGFVAALAFSACSNEDGLTTGGNDANGIGSDQKFLTVNIVSTPASRAAGDQHTGDPDGNATYEEGTARENTVNKVRFFFFNANGNAAPVVIDPITTKSVNYRDWTKEIEADGDNLPNVEKQLAATVVINTQLGDQIPSKIVAVLNPTESFEDETDGDLTTLTSLRTLMRDYAAEARDNNFVMYNSVYANGTTLVDVTDIPVTSFQPSAALAKANPVNIYVERVVAKVRVRLTTTDADNKEEIKVVTLKDGEEAIELKDNDGNSIRVDGNQVYLRLSKWNVTADPNTAYLRKKINAAWDANLFGSEKWNWSPYFRSYWAQNPEAGEYGEGEGQQYSSWNTSVETGKNYTSGYVYTNENASQTEANHECVTGPEVAPFSKVIMMGELVYETKDAEGADIVAPVTICKYAGLTVIGVNALKDALLAQIRATGMLYSYTTVTENGVTSTRFATITRDDVTFNTALKNENVTKVDESEMTSGRYYVCLTLSTTGRGKRWTYDNDPETENREVLTATEVNKHLYDQIGQCMIYNGGKTYYFFPIRHLGDENHVGYYGVVRNHIYDCNITKLTGLGTPVYDPNETIWPEKPKDEDTFIGAKINILSWRVVPNDYKLEW